MAVLAALRRRRKKTIPTTQPKKFPIAGENVAEANCSPVKRSMSSLRSCSTEAIEDGSDKCRVFPSTAGNDNIAQPSSAVPTTTSIATGMIALSDSRATLGRSMVEPGSSFITPVTLAIDSAPESARMTPTNWTQSVPRLSWRGWRKCVVRCGALMPIKITTTINVGTARATARLPECFGPKKLIAPMIKSIAMVVSAM